MEMTKQHALEALSSVLVPATGKDLVTSGMVGKVAACDGYVSVALNLADLPAPARTALLSAAEAALRGLAERQRFAVRGLTVEAAGGPAAPAAAPVAPQQNAQHNPQQNAPGLPGVKTIIAVGAGKGGVGKSTVAVNIAVGLALRGHAVGLLDGDIYGPSLPTMLGLDSMQVNILGNMLQPFLVHGVKAMTIGKLVDPEKALIWRGPMAHGAFKQLIDQTEWGELDYMVIDLPPGTGDVSLTLAQSLRLTGAILVCTPQKVAQDDAVRAARMFQQLGIDVLGLVENMSYFIGDDGKEYDLFGRGGAEKMAQRLGIPFLGAVPINTALRKNSDSGEPLKNFAQGSKLGKDLDAVVQQVEAQVALANLRLADRTPTLTIS